MKIKNVMSTPVVVVPPYTAVCDVARQMDHSGVGSVVVSDGQEVIGIVTDRDLVLRVLGQGGDGQAQVRQVMTRDPATVRPDDDLDVAVEMFRRSAFRRLPVVEAGTVIGLLSVDDLLLRVNQLTADLLRPLARQISTPGHFQEG
ncbi:CBS domain-containing protein [Nonomuraea sp. NPDC003804]|uniref:CBS domain-containing protein n=1 Tax=Nonomuraea sp. NPDC003804 TaxID=3154547 RepID=UPI00339FA164